MRSCLNIVIGFVNIYVNNTISSYKMIILKAM